MSASKSPRKKTRILTAEEEKALIAQYVNGGITQRILAQNWNVSKTKVQTLLQTKKQKELLGSGDASGNSCVQ